MKIYNANSTEERVVPQEKSKKIATIIRRIEPSYKDSAIFPFTGFSQTYSEKFALFWELMDTIERHGYLRSAMSTVGRSAIGAWWNIAEHPNYQGRGVEAKKRKLIKFYSAEARQWDNIKDYQGLVYKLQAAAMYLKYFGQAAFYIVRNNNGEPIGIDFLHGLIVPNVDSDGYFKTPAFIQFISADTSEFREFKVNEVVYMSNPDWRGSPLGGTDIEALAEYNLPTDIYLQTAAREYLKNRDRPDVIYELPEGIDDEAFDDFVEIISQKYRGASNIGKSPIAVQGELNIKELSKMPEGLPFEESRNGTRNELMSTTGVNPAKMGLAESEKTDLREMRKEFHETTMMPLFRAIEEALYEQIHVREFGIKEWMFKFKSPDFLTAVENATVYMRFHDMGVLSPNEIRQELGRTPREGGDEYYTPYGFIPETDAPQDSENPHDDRNSRGSPPEGREDRPDKPSNTGEPTLDDQDPPRGDQHNDAVSTNIDKQPLIDELYKWRDFGVKRVKSGNPMRRFESTILPEFVVENVNRYLLERQDHTKESVKDFFDGIITIIKEM